MITKTEKNQARLKRHMRIRRRMQGSPDKPRFVFIVPTNIFMPKLLMTAKHILLYQRVRLITK